MLPAGLLLNDNVMSTHSRVVPADSTQGNISLGGQKKRKGREIRESRSEQKVMRFSQSPYSPQGNGRQSPRVKATGIDHPAWRITQGVSVVKGSERGRIPDAFT